MMFKKVHVFAKSTSYFLDLHICFSVFVTPIKHLSVECPSTFIDREAFMD